MISLFLCRRSAPIETIINIHDHDDQPFQQKQIFYPDENITEIEVDAHKQFERNTFFLVPNINMRISVIGNHTCILADINAYKIDDVEEGKLIKWSLISFILLRISERKF